MARPRKFIDRSVWDAIFERYVIPFKDWNAHQSRPTIIPHKDGEPLLNKNLPSLLESARRVPSMAVDIYTHGLLLTKEFVTFLGKLPNKARLLITFHFVNHDGSENDYSKANQVIRWALDHRPKNLEIILVTHVTDGVPLDRLLGWQAAWGSVATVNKDINPWTGRISDSNAVTHGHCPYDSFNHVFFGVTGNVVACCMDLEEELVFGNVMTDEPLAVMERLRDFYAAQKRRELRSDLCNNCFGVPKLHQLGVVS